MHTRTHACTQAGRHARTHTHSGRQAGRQARTHTVTHSLQLLTYSLSYLVLTPMLCPLKNKPTKKAFWANISQSLLLEFYRRLKIKRLQWLKVKINVPWSDRQKSSQKHTQAKRNNIMNKVVYLNSVNLVREITCFIGKTKTKLLLI